MEVSLQRQPQWNSTAALDADRCPTGSDARRCRENVPLGFYVFTPMYLDIVYLYSIPITSMVNIAAGENLENKTKLT